MRGWTSCALTVALLAVASSFAAAGGRWRCQAPDQAALTSLNSPELAAFNEAANSVEGNFIVRLCWYTAPYKGGYAFVTVDELGHAVAYRDTPGWSTANLGNKVLDPKQLQRLRQLVDLVASSESPQPPGAVAGKRHLAFTIRQGAGIYRRDFVGDAPKEINEIADLVLSGLGAARQF